MTATDKQNTPNSAHIFHVVTNKLSQTMRAKLNNSYGRRSPFSIGIQNTTRILLTREGQEIKNQIVCVFNMCCAKGKGHLSQSFQKIVPGIPWIEAVTLLGHAYLPSLQPRFDSHARSDLY